MIFDTHLGHRKDAYLALGSPWLKATDWRATLHMFAAFAADARVRWHSVQRVTALSFHGRRRIAMARDERSRELADWSRQMCRPLFEQRLRRRGSYSFHTLRLVRAFAKAQAGREETHAFLTSLLRKASTPFVPTLQQRRSIDTVIALIFGGLLPGAGAREVFADLLDARLGSDFNSIRQVIDLFRGYIPADRLLDDLGSQTTTPSTAFARLYLRAPVGLTDPALIREANEAFAAAPSVTRFHFAEAVAGLLFESGDAPASWDWTERALPLAPQSFHSVSYWRLRVRLAQRLGYDEQAEHATSQLARQSALMD